MNDMEISKSYSIEQIENEQHLIINAYYMNQKVATTDAGSIDNIMEKVKLFNEEYETLQQENQLMFEIQDNYNQLQFNWNSLREWVQSEYNRYLNDTENLIHSNVEIIDFSRILDKMNELESSDNK